MDPELLKQLIEALGQQQSANLEAGLKPRGKIAKSGESFKGLEGWYALNPQARPGETYNQEQSRVKADMASRNQLEGMDREIAFRNKKAELDKARGTKSKAAGGAGAVAKGLGSWVQGIFGGGKPAASKGTAKVSPQQRAANLADSQANWDSGIQTKPKFQSADPQVQNAMELGDALRGYKAANPGAAAMSQYGNDPSLLGPPKSTVDPWSFPPMQDLPTGNTKQSPKSARPNTALPWSFPPVQELLPQTAQTAEGYGAPPMTNWLPSLGLPSLTQRPMAGAPQMQRLPTPGAAPNQTMPGNVMPMPMAPVGPVGSWPSSPELYQEMMNNLNQRAYVAPKPYATYSQVLGDWIRPAR